MTKEDGPILLQIVGGKNEEAVKASIAVRRSSIDALVQAQFAPSKRESRAYFEMLGRNVAERLFIAAAKEGWLDVDD